MRQNEKTANKSLFAANKYEWGLQIVAPLAIKFGKVFRKLGLNCLRLSPDDHLPADGLTRRVLVMILRR